MCIAGRILGYCEHGPTFFVREILDGIAAQPGGDYSFISTVVYTRYRQVVPQSRVKYHVTPWGCSGPEQVNLGFFSSWSTVRGTH